MILGSLFLFFRNSLLLLIISVVNSNQIIKWELMFVSI